MAITLSGSPQIIAPAYNPTVYFVDSDNKTEPSFRYVVDVYEAGTTNKIGEYRVAPRPSDGLGYVDISKLIDSTLTYDFNPTLTTYDIASNSFYDYDIKFGEEYSTAWLYDDFEVGGGTGTTYCNVKLTTLTAATGHNFSTGDQVVVTQVSGGTALNKSINGLHTVVLGLTGSTDQYIIIDDLWVCGGGAVVSGGPFGGSIVFADNRNTVYRDLLAVTGQTAFNGALPFNTFNAYDYSNYGLASIISTIKCALTDMPTVFGATPDQDIWFNYMKDPADAGLQTIVFTNSNGDVLSKDMWTAATGGSVNQTSVGPNNANPTTVISGTTTLVKSDTTWYEFQTERFSIPTSKTYRINIDNRCKIEDYEILFLDRMGSFVSYAFQLRAKELGSITKQTYNKQLGDLVVDEWGYDTSDAGKTVYDVNVTKKLTLNTDWMTDDMSVYFEQLLTSPVTYVKIDGSYYSCQILESSFETARQKNKNLIRKTITIQLSNDNIINI